MDIAAPSARADASAISILPPSHRIGQTKDVLVIRLETAGSIEEGVRAVAARKMEVAERAITGGFFDGGQTSEEDRNDFLQALLRANDAAGDAAKAAVPSDAALNALIARSDAERELFDREDASRAASEARYWARLLASAPPGSLPQQLPPRLAGPVEAAPIIDRMNARATAAAVAAAAETETLGRGARKRVQLNGYVEIGERAFTKLCEEGAVGGAELVPLHKPAPAEPKEAPEPQADEPDAADAAPQAADAEPAAAAAEPVAAEAAEAAAPAAAPTRKRPQSAEEAAEEAPPAKRPRCPPAAAPDAEGAGDAADAAAGPRTFDSWREVTLRQPSKLRLLKFYLVDSATRSEVRMHAQCLLLCLADASRASDAGGEGHRGRRPPLPLRHHARCCSRRARGGGHRAAHARRGGDVPESAHCCLGRRRCGCAVARGIRAGRLASRLRPQAAAGGDGRRASCQAPREHAGVTGGGRARAACRRRPAAAAR